MTYISIFEKFKILFDTIMGFDFILMFLGMMLVITFIFLIKKMSTKMYMILMILLFAGIFGISIVSNYEILSNTFDNFATIFFSNIYFPSIYVYISVLVISFISFVVIIFNIMLKKIYKVINSIMFVINNILFAIVLNIIAENRIDIFSINSLYTNTSLVAVLELSMGLFVVWLLSLVATYTTNCICDRIANKKIVKESITKNIFNPVIEISDDLINDVNASNDSISSNGVNVRTLLACDNASLNDVICDEKTFNTDDCVYEERFDNVMIDNTDFVEEVNEVENNAIIEEVNTVNFTDSMNDVVNACNDNAITFNDILRDNALLTYYADDEFDNNNINNLEEIDVVQKEQLLVEETNVAKKECMERLAVNTISLNDLIDDEDIIVKEKDSDIDAFRIEEQVYNNDNYTIDDYKKIINMLTELKNYSSGKNMTIDDAVALSLISNYSVDDCMKFKNILENNLN